MEVHDKIRVIREINQWSQEEMAGSFQCHRMDMPKLIVDKAVLI